MRLVLAANREMNLTAITDPEDFEEKHLFDSLAGLEAVQLRAGTSLLDLGSGAGVPGIPLALAVPGVNLTLVDASLRKTRFLERAVRALDLGARVVHARAEDLGRAPGWRAAFDRVVARAVAPLNVLVELGLPLVRVGGLLVAWKGPAADVEVAAAGRALGELGGQLASVKPLRLPRSGDERRIVVIEKQRPTPERYPRRTAAIRRRPL